ncbi:MAG: hypothetical protein GKS05_10360 [Nitrospirales bacterium]|nr:hypothetical protein [Nitrospirales bacterium]
MIKAQWPTGKKRWETEKLWVLGISLALIGMMAFPNILVFAKDQVSKTSSGTTWTVALDGTGQFFSIQEALDQAKSGDTIWIQAGRYLEDVTVHSKENIHVRGEGMDKVFIAGLNRVGTLHVGKWPYGATNIEISGLTVQQHGGLSLGVFNGEHVVLRNLRIKGMAFGQQVNGLQVEDCLIGGSETSGIAFADSRATLRGNFIHDNDHGIAVGGTSIVHAEKNVITRSLFDAVLVADTAQATIIQNTLINNNTGVRFQDDATGDVRGNILVKNRQAGMVLSINGQQTTAYNGFHDNPTAYLITQNKGPAHSRQGSDTDVNARPQFVDPDHDDFRLQPNTPFLHIGSFHHLGALAPIDPTPSVPQ